MTTPPIRRGRLWTPTVLLFAVFALLGYQSWANNAAVRMPPAVIAAVNIERVFEGLNQKIQADADLQNAMNVFQAEIDERRNKMTQLSEEILDYPPGSDMYNEAVAVLTRASANLQAYSEYSRTQLEKDQNLMLHQLYVDIRAAAKSLALESGYDMVLVDDSAVELPSITDANISQQISARRMLFTNPTIDITDELITRMNQ